MLGGKTILQVISVAGQEFGSGGTGNLLILAIVLVMFSSVSVQNSSPKMSPGFMAFVAAAVS